MIYMANGTRYEVVEDDFANFQKSPRVTVRLTKGDVYTRKKGYGWQRKITSLTWVDENLFVGYVKHLGDGKFEPAPWSCTADALLNWGKKE
tara:strand:- start:1649 stop:1921 length:273 start_codon:yes stop_codon:yes gene_type:complete